jgi:hypothetical protein
MVMRKRNEYLSFVLPSSLQRQRELCSDLFTYLSKLLKIERKGTSMFKLGKYVVALALSLIMSLALLTGSFAQSVNRHAASTPAQATVAHVAHWGGFFGGFDDFDFFDCDCFF